MRRPSGRRDRKYPLRHTDPARGKTVGRVPDACYNEAMSIQPEHTSLLTSTPTETEAAIVLAALDQNGIRASSDAVSSNLQAGPWNWVEIRVAEDDLPRAKELLEKVQRENAHIDWSQIDIGEPEDE